MSIYSDLNRKDTRTRSRVVDLEAVMNSFQNSIAQPPRQRLFRPEGSGFSQLLFRVDPDIDFKLKNILYRIVARDPRIVLNYSETEVIPDVDNHQWTLVARFSVRGFENLVQTRIVYIKAA
jgi:phage baseplate assembly protein W